MAITTPITGNATVGVGQTSTLANATAGGSWSSSNTAIATINGAGVMTGVAKGTCTIIYTVGADSIATTATVSQRSLSNGFDIDTVYRALKNRVLWQSQGVNSDSNRYFEDFHVLNNVDLLMQLQPDSAADRATYLENLQRSVILNMVNAVYPKPQIIDNTKLCFYRGDWMLVPLPVTNQHQFVGLKMVMAKGDFAIRFNSIELFFDKDCTFNMYLYNDMTLPPIYTKSVTASAMEQVIIDLSEDAILNYLTPTINKGGIVYFGYYQDDIEKQGAKAMYYSIANQLFHPCWIWAFSAPMQVDVQGNRNFKRNNIGANNMTYGMNIEVTTYTDPTNNIVQMSHLFDNLIGLQMAAKVLEQIVFSYRSNGDQRTVQGIDALQHLYEELNLAKPSEDIPYSVGLRKQIQQEVIRVKQAFQRVDPIILASS